MIEIKREAALRPGAAKLYPYLPARMWTAASRIAELVARYQGRVSQAVGRACRLSEVHFTFRDRSTAQ
jgi:hypothetical protein